MKQNIDKEIITVIKTNNLVLKMFIYQVMLNVFNK